MNKKISTEIIIGAIVIIIITIGGYFWLQGQQKFGPGTTPIQNYQKTEKNKAINWQIYKNNQIGFELSYPTNWKIMKLDANSEKISLGFTPIKLDNYPTCTSYIEGLKNTPNEERSEYFARTGYCIIGIIIDNNPNELPLKDYLKKVYDKNKKHTEKIDNLKVLKLENGVETTKTEGFSFLRTGGFDGSADNPSLIGTYDQFIFKKGKYIVFITNKVNDEISKTDSIYEKIISTIKFK